MYNWILDKKLPTIQVKEYIVSLYRINFVWLTRQKKTVQAKSGFCDICLVFAVSIALLPQE